MPPVPPRKTPPVKPLKTVRQVAEEDNVSEKTVRRAIAAGLLPVLRVGPAKRTIRIHPDAHEAYRQMLRR